MSAPTERGAKRWPPVLRLVKPTMCNAAPAPPPQPPRRRRRRVLRLMVGGRVVRVLGE